MVHTIGGRILFQNHVTWEELNKRVERGDVFRKTNITEKYTFDEYLQERDEHTLLMFCHKPTGRIEFFTEGASPKIEQGDVIVSLTQPCKEKNKIQQKLNVQRDNIEKENKQKESAE